MDIKSKRKMIRKTFYSAGGLILISILGTIGLIFLYYTGIFNVGNISEFYECLAKGAMIIIFCAFFVFVWLYCWISFFINIVLPPKDEVLYLDEIQDGEAIFLSKKGKKFYFIFDKNNLEEKSYYHALKTHDYIYEVLEKTNESWITKEKRSYWLNFYSPMGNFENIFLLPIVYVILLPGILAIITAEGFSKLFGVIFCAVPLYVIIYDLIYKIKLKNNINPEEIDETKFIKSYEILKNVISIILVSIVIIVFSIIYFKITDIKSKMILLPFYGGLLCTFGLILSKMFKNEQLEHVFNKIYIIIFLMYWFGFILFFTISAIKEEENYMLALFTIPFWIVGFLMLYKYIIKKEK